MVKRTIGSYIVIGVVAFGLLLWLWPNLVHEPLHLVALTLQGSSGVITFHWGFPAHPETMRTAAVDGVIGGLFYLLLPSCFSVLLLAVLWLTRRRAAFLTHVVLPVYLSFDLIINILHNGSQASDFRFLQVLQPWIGIVAVMVVSVLGCAVLLAGLQKVKDVLVEAEVLDDDA